MTEISSSVGTIKAKRFSTYCRMALSLLCASAAPAAIAPGLHLALHQSSSPQPRIEQIPQGISQHIESKYR
jgi:hypothetical protein